jgi:hypothetical protein
MYSETTARLHAERTAAARSMCQTPRKYFDLAREGYALRGRGLLVVFCSTYDTDLTPTYQPHARVKDLYPEVYARSSDLLRSYDPAAEFVVAIINREILAVFLGLFEVECIRADGKCSASGTNAASTPLTQ